MLARYSPSKLSSTLDSIENLIKYIGEKLNYEIDFKDFSESMNRAQFCGH